MLFDDGGGAARRAVGGKIPGEVHLAGNPGDAENEKDEHNNRSKKDGPPSPDDEGCNRIEKAEGYHPGLCSGSGPRRREKAGSGGNEDHGDDGGEQDAERGEYAEFHDQLEPGRQKRGESDHRGQTRHHDGNNDPAERGGDRRGRVSRPARRERQDIDDMNAVG